ncbi:MAG: peptidase S24 [Saprospiraceae bacterium]|nr:peptidase S24 [Candidatus Defluviibacterium haderslevense]
MKKLHPRQSILLKLLKDNIDNPLTMLDLSKESEINSPGVLYFHLKQLEKKGYLKRNPENPKDYNVMDLPEKKVVYINKYGLAQCGPNGTVLSGKIEERIPIASSLLKFPVELAFIVEAKGDSMEPKIKNGDIIIAKKQNYAESGDIVVCVFNEVAIIKQYLVIERRIILNSFNKDERLLEVFGESEIKIEGIVKNIIQYN